MINYERYFWEKSMYLVIHAIHDQIASASVVLDAPLQTFEAVASINTIEDIILDELKPFTVHPEVLK